MYNKTRSPADWVKSIVLCGGISLVVTILLCMLFGVLILKEVFPQGAIDALAIVICLLSVLPGAWLSAKLAGQNCIPVALASAVVYLVLTLSLKGLFFRGGFGQAAYLLPAAAVAAVIGGLLGAHKKKRHK